MSCNTQDLVIEQAKTFSRVLRWETAPIVYKPITAITQAAPAVVTATAHGIPAGWRVALLSVKGMVQINSQNTPPRSADYHKATVVDPNTVSFNDINSLGYSAYTSGGVLAYNTPTPLTGYTAAMSIKDKIGGTELLRLDTVGGRIAIDTVNMTITLTIDATTTAGLTWTSGVYDLKLISSTGVATELLAGNVSVDPAVTTT